MDTERTRGDSIVYRFLGVHINSSMEVLLSDLLEMKKIDGKEIRK